MIKPLSNISEIIAQMSDDISDTVAQLEERRVERRQAETLTDEEEDLEWAGTISVGTPPQKFLIDFDSKRLHSCTSLLRSHPPLV